jgi:hypothetical protein
MISQGVLIGAVCIAVGCGVVNAQASLMMPAFINATLCFLFLASFVVPPNMIERFAISLEGAVPPQARAYCARVCVVWIVFFAINAGIAFDSAFRSLEWWALYNGAISYCLIGAIFGCEYLVRRLVKRKIMRLAQLGCLLVFCMYPVFAANTEPRPLTLPDIKSNLTPPGPFRVEFAEKRFVTVLSQPLESQGVMRCMPNYGLIWHTTAPIPRTSVITRRAIVEMRNEHVVQTTVDAAGISQAMLSLMSGALTEVDHHCEVSISGNSANWHVQLSPKDALVRQVIASLSVKGAQRPQLVEVLYASGDRVLTVFSKPEMLSLDEIEGTKDLLRRVS